jgi:hypothetical protein
MDNGDAIAILGSPRYNINKEYLELRCLSKIQECSLKAICIRNQ